MSKKRETNKAFIEALRATRASLVGSNLLLQLTKVALYTLKYTLDTGWGIVREQIRGKKHPLDKDECFLRQPVH